MHLVGSVREHMFVGVCAGLLSCVFMGILKLLYSYLITYSFFIVIKIL